MKLNPDRDKTPEQKAWENGYRQGFENGKAMAATPAPVPLTDEQIAAIWRDLQWSRNLDVEVVRAIERAHGIGVSTGGGNG